MEQNKKAQHEMALSLSWAFMFMRDHMTCESLQIFFWEDRHLSGRVEITLGKWILRETHPNGMVRGAKIFQTFPKLIIHNRII